MMIVVRYPSLSAPVCAPVGAQRTPLMQSTPLMKEDFRHRPSSGVTPLVRAVEVEH